jgi:hypothetical protein
MERKTRVNVNIHTGYHNSTPSSRGLVPPKLNKEENKYVSRPQCVRRRWTPRPPERVMNGDLAVHGMETFGVGLGASDGVMFVLLLTPHTHLPYSATSPENLRVELSAKIRPSSLTRQASHRTKPIIVSTNCPAAFISITT